jgi:hypothetical protein
MGEVTIARFPFLHEAEYAKGFLDDAGVRCWLKPDAAAGGTPYIGGLAGAVLAVAPADVDRSLDVLRAAGVLEEAGAGASHPALPEESIPPALRADLHDLQGELRRARKREVRHFVWAMFGVSPAALIPLLGLALEGEVALVALLCVMVVFVEGSRWIRAGKEVKRLEEALETLLQEIEAEGPAGPS